MQLCNGAYKKCSDPESSAGIRALLRERTSDRCNQCCGLSIHCQCRRTEWNGSRSADRGNGYDEWSALELKPYSVAVFKILV